MDDLEDVFLMDCADPEIDFYSVMCSESIVKMHDLVRKLAVYGRDSAGVAICNPNEWSTTLYCVRELLAGLIL